MFRKLYSFALIAVLIGSLVSPSNSLAKEQKLSYDQVLQELESTKKEIQLDTDLTLKEKEKISNESSKMVEQFFHSNQDLEQDKIAVVVKSLDEIDVFMYDVATEKGNTNFGSKSINFKKSDSKSEENVEPTVSASAYWSGKGDILISMVAKTYGFSHGHAGILSTTTDYVIEALPSPGVVEHSASKYWSTVSDETQYYVKGAPDSSYINAVSFARSQVNDPYKLETSLSDNTQWYCSKLVYRAWKAAGYNVGGSQWIYGYVLPNGIAADGDTIAYKWNPYR